MPWNELGTIDVNDEQCPDAFEQVEKLSAVVDSDDFMVFFEPGADEFMVLYWMDE